MEINGQLHSAVALSGHPLNTKLAEARILLHVVAKRTILPLCWDRDQGSNVLTAVTVMHHFVQNCSGITPPPMQLIRGEVSFPGVTWQDREADHLSASNAEIKNRGALLLRPLTIAADGFFYSFLHQRYLGGCIQKFPD
jgi:hypothetical protein